MKRTFLALAVGAAVLASASDEAGADVKRSQANLSDKVMVTWGTATLEKAADGKGRVVVSFGVPYGSPPTVTLTVDMSNKLPKDWPAARGVVVVQKNVKAFTIVGDSPGLQVDYFVIGPKP